MDATKQNSSEQNRSSNENGHSSETTTFDRTMTPIQPPVENRHPARLTPNSRLTFGSGNADPTYSVLRSKLIRQTLTQPMNLTRILMQIGYEPLGATPGKTLLGKEVMYYPNVLRYMKYIYREEGLKGFYRGFGCSIMSTAVCWYTASKVEELIIPDENQSNSDEENLSWNTCISKTLREVQCQSWGILVSHPFQVMFVRCVGQFVGRENIYSSFNVLRNVQEIYEREGIGGFFVGLIPRWLAETATIILTNVIIQLLRTNLSSQKDLINLFDVGTGLIVQSITYPWNLTSNIVMINRSGLQAARLPSIPACTDWQDTFKYLCQTKQLKRGSQFFGRVAIGYTNTGRL